MTQRQALLIGNSKYNDLTLSKLTAPEVDVTALKHLLEQEDFGGFEQVTCLLNKSNQDIRNSIARFYKDVGSEDLLLFYFSGHGILDENGTLYLGTFETNVELLEATAIPASYISQLMDKSFSKRLVVILDCCFSGAFGRGIKGVIRNYVGTKEIFNSSGFGKAILTASDSTQYAWEGNQIIGEVESSLFTHFLIEGIRDGTADLDLDGIITVDELYQYIYKQISQKTHKQKPRLWASDQEGKIIIARNPKVQQKKHNLVAEKIANSTKIKNVTDNIKITLPQTNQVFFVVAKSQTTFGMAKKSKEPEIDFTLRVLPSNSRQKNPENWMKSAMISKIHGRIKILHDQAMLKDESRNGIFIRGTTKSDHDALESLSDWSALYGTLEEEEKPEHSYRDFVRIPPQKWIPIPQYTQISLGENLLHLGIDVLKTKPTDLIDGIRITRLSNFENHQYIQLVNKVTIGKSPTCGININHQDYPELAGEIFYTSGQFFIKPYVDQFLSINSQLLSANSLYEVMPHTQLYLGSALAVFDSTADEDFTITTIQ